MEGKAESAKCIEDALYFFQKQSESDSREINLLRKQVERMREAGNILASYCSETRATSVWKASLCEKHMCREEMMGLLGEQAPR